MADGFSGCAERKWFCGRWAMQAIEPWCLDLCVMWIESWTGRST